MRRTRILRQGTLSQGTRRKGILNRGILNRAILLSTLSLRHSSRAAVLLSLKAGTWKPTLDLSIWIWIWISSRSLDLTVLFRSGSRIFFFTFYGDPCGLRRTIANVPTMRLLLVGHIALVWLVGDACEHPAHDNHSAYRALGGLDDRFLSARACAPPA